MIAFQDRLKSDGVLPFRADGVEILQVNLGYRCNMSCKHCHVNAGPSRTEIMSEEDIERIIRIVRGYPIKILDLTGGAPELNPHFRYLLRETVKAGVKVLVRTNLTIFFEEGMADLPRFFHDQGVDVVASLPNYTEDSVDRVRGNGTFAKSIQALRMLNDLGFGKEGTGLKLNLVFNPQGAFFPPDQGTLQDQYRKELGERFGIIFNNLYTFTNMPIGRFRDFLTRTNNLEKYMDRLVCSFNPATLEGVMCRKLISVRWDGMMFDCDFNQMIGLGLQGGIPGSIRDFDHDELSSREIALGDHCYGCTAGQGST